jgi:hypothetical protein
VTDLAPSPPATNVWPHADIVTGALAVLRLGPDDVDADRVDTAALTAEEMLDAFIDAPEPLPPITAVALLTGAVNLTVETYRRKDAPFGVLNAWSVDEVAVRIGPDAIRAIRTMVMPHKRRWGIA